MSRKKIVAATMTAAALGLAFAGYTASSANGTEELPRHARPLPVSADAGYRQNHQVGHNSAVFEWLNATASLDRSTGLHPGHHYAQEELVADTQDEIEPVALEHANRIGLGGWAGYGLVGRGGGTHKSTDEGSGGRYASNNFAFGFGGAIGSFGGGGGGGGASNNSHNNNPKGTSGTNDSAGDTPHQDAPAGSNNNPDNQPGTNQPKADEPPTTGPSTLNPTNPDQPGEKDEHTPGGPNVPTPTNGGDGPPPGDHTTPTDNTHSVPEPATLGLFGFGMIAAAALRRRRRN